MAFDTTTFVISKREGLRERERERERKREIVCICGMANHVKAMVCVSGKS